MSEIAPINRIEGLIHERVGKAQPPKPVAQEAPSRGRDNVELSDHARFLSQIRDLPQVRQGLIDNVKTQIDAGKYESEDKIDTLIDALAEDLA